MHNLCQTLYKDAKIGVNHNNLIFVVNLCLSDTQQSLFNSGSESFEQEESGFDEEEILKYYFYRGFSCQEILVFLSDRHQYEISYSTLLRRLKSYGLMRRGITNQDGFDDTFLQLQGRMHELIRGSGGSVGYRSMWHTLEMEGLRVPRVIVEDLLAEMDPEELHKGKNVA